MYTAAPFKYDFPSLSSGYDNQGRITEVRNTELLVTGHVDLDHEWRGGQWQAYLLATGLAARGHPTHVFTQPDTPLARRLRGSAVQVHELKYRGEWDVFAARRLAAMVRDAGVQLVATHASHSHGLCAVARHLGLEAPLVVHRRVDFAVAKNFLSRRKYATPEGFVAVSEAVKQYLIDGGVKPERIWVVLDGVPDHVPVPDAKTKLARETGLDADAPWVGDVASFVDHKGHVHLLNAWAKVMEQGVRAELVLVGDGELRPRLEAQIARLNLAHAHLVGWQDDVSAWLSSFDIFAMTSVTDGLCSAILDAMAARIPVVATAAGGIPEIVSHDKTGLLAPVGDANAIAAYIIEALRDRQKMSALADRAYEEVWRTHSADVMVEKTLAVYREIVSRS